MDTIQNPIQKDGVGSIIVQVYTARGAFPVEGALVTLSDVKKGDSTVLFTQITDKNGKTEKISVFAPPKAMSQKPDSTLPPYSLYNIAVTKEGYYSVSNSNVPIFSGVTAIQPVELVPLPQGEDNNLYPSDLTRFNENTPPNL